LWLSDPSAGVLFVLLFMFLVCGLKMPIPDCDNDNRLIVDWYHG